MGPPRPLGAGGQEAGGPIVLGWDPIRCSLLQTQIALSGLWNYARPLAYPQYPYTRQSFTLKMIEQRGTPALHLNEPTWIIDGFNELIVDFLFALVIFLDSTQPRPLKSSK